LAVLGFELRVKETMDTLVSFLILRGQFPIPYNVGYRFAVHGLYYAEVYPFYS
jgi:hypothetical protein